MVQPEGVEPVAIVGLAVRVPGAADERQFWRNLVDGVMSVTDFTREEQIARGAEDADVDDPSWVSAAPMIEGFDEFDAGLFGMTAREAQITDPQHRLLLEACHVTLEDAGYDPARYDGAIGVYAGSGANNYMWHNVMRNRRVLDSQSGGIGVATGNQPSYLATGVSYKLNLSGPSMTVHTACSTSLVALHLACEALRNGECEMALAGGVNLEVPHGVGYVGVEGFTSPDARCRPFDAEANGTVWGSGVGVVLLKRLADALADGDRIRGVVLGNAVNNDGASKVGFSAPSMEGQIGVVAQAVAMAGIDPRSISYVEAHGTGTALGDPIEVAALSTVYGAETEDRGWCGIGSVKSNIGHLSQAAGVVSVIKAVLAMEHGVIPPTLNFRKANPAIDFDATPFRIVDRISPWRPEGGPLRAGVSSFGVGGTNVHVVLEQAPQPATADAADAAERPQLLRLSARTETALDRASEQLADFLARNPETDLAAAAHTLHVGRVPRAHRAFVVARDAEDAAEALRDPRRRRTAVAAKSAPRVAFLFSGQGSQYGGMAAELYREEPVFAAAVDRCAAALDLDRDIRELIFATGSAADAALRETRHTQPALFVVEYALAALWASWGVRPEAMIGHSIGEYVAATLAGVFEVEDAVRLVAARGRLMQSLPPGSMLAVGLGEAETAGRLPAGVEIATVNGPGTCVVAGPSEAVAAFAETLRTADIPAKPLRTSHAFHSSMTEPILEEFTALVAAVPRHAPKARFLSNLTGDWITEEQACDPAYWAAHLRRAVRFGACLETLFADGDWTLLECGPGRQLAGLARPQVPQGGAVPLTSLPGPGERIGDLEKMLTEAGALWAAGVPVSAGDGPHRRIALPTYPFERARHWVEPDKDDAAPVRATGPLPLDRWFAVPTWRQIGPETAREPIGTCLAFVEDAELPARLRAAGAAVIEVRPGDAFAVHPNGFTIRPGAREDYDALLGALGPEVPARIVHAYALAGQPAGSDIDAAWAAQDRGFFSVLWLTQALAAAGRTEGTVVDVISSGTADVTGADLLRPEHATLAGVARVVPLESPGLVIRRVDADPADPYRGLLDELTRPGPGEVALRAGRRWVTDYDQLTVPAETADRLREGGRYLITGGLGGVGITLAEDLARRVRARLVLVTRSGLPPREQWDAHVAAHGGADRAARAILAIRRMEAAGAEVLVAAADVSSPDDLRRVRGEVEAAFGGLDGIVHAAGVPGGGMAEIKERAAAEAVLAPKLAGTLALRQAFGDVPMDFVALCSSITAVSGDFGQVDYCAANNFLDAHARAGHGWQAPVVSHNWGGWAEVGMAAEVAAPTAIRSTEVAAAEPVDHPILTSRTPAGCHGIVSAATHWVLDEHRIDGIPVVPGTAHLECARAAVAACVPRPSEDHVVELRDVVFLEPFAVPDTAEYRVELSGGEFEIVSRIAGRTRSHVRGSADWVLPKPAGSVDVAADRTLGTAIEDGEGFGQTGRTGMVTFGPRWSVLTEHRIAESDELALITATGEDGDGDWTLNPALLDVATAFGRGRGTGTYLPLGYGRIVVRAPLTPTFFSHLTYRGSDSAEVVAADLLMYDESGRVLVEVEDFVLRRVDRGAVVGGMADGAAPAAPPPVDGMIRPVDGAEAFRRALSGDLGPQIVISTVPVTELFARLVTSTELAEDVEPGGVAGEVKQSSASTAYTAPRTELEAMLATLWAGVLGVDQVGVDQDFFELGGNSLVAVQVIAQIRKATGVRLPMRVLFEAQTVAELAVRIEALRGAETGPDEGGIPKLSR